MTAAADRERSEREALAAELALGVLDGDDRRTAERLAATDSAFAAMVDDWRERLLPLAEAYAPVPPPAAIKPALEARLFGAAPGAAATAAGSWWNSLALWRPLAIAASLAAIVLAGMQLSGPQPDAAPLVAALSAEGGPVRYVAYFDRGEERLTLTRLDQPAAQGRDHELWLIAGDSAPVSLGVLSRQEGVSLQVRADSVGTLAAGAVLAVSDEPSGGSPTGAPTGAIVAAGPVKSF